eukprot:GHVQ01024412.1.p1 GENE.GHVQ01024412.1~~GHVQ01024412.1.p1  ORF type:complete len:325 (+),score=36.08 GHVQ01024412.1:38-976(+)
MAGQRCLPWVRSKMGKATAVFVPRILSVFSILGPLVFSHIRSLQSFVACSAVEAVFLPHNSSCFLAGLNGPYVSQRCTQVNIPTAYRQQQNFEFYKNKDILAKTRVCNGYHSMSLKSFFDKGDLEKPVNSVSQHEDTPETDSRFKKNREITADMVRIINDGSDSSLLSTEEALEKADSQGLDLIQVRHSRHIPVCLIMRYQQFLYQQKKAEKQKASKQRAVSQKEIRIGARIGDHDINFKCNMARKFLLNRNPVRFKMRLKRNDMKSGDLPLEVFSKIQSVLKDVATPQQLIKLDGSFSQNFVFKSRTIQKK